MQASNGEADIENRLMDMVGLGEEGAGEMHGESNMETYIAIGKIDSKCVQNDESFHLTRGIRNSKTAAYGIKKH